MVTGAQCPSEECGYNFFLIRYKNAALWHSYFPVGHFLTHYRTACLLESTGRVTLMMYVAMGCPVPKTEWILSHKPRYLNSNWNQIIQWV